MIRRILRSGLGVVFFFVFFCFLFVGALKFRALSPKFWKTALNKGGVYQQLHDQVTKMQMGLEESIKEQAGGKALPPKVAEELVPLLFIDKVLTADRFKGLIETNIDRLSDYLNGKDENLILYLPVVEWKLPIQAFDQPALSSLTAQTPVKDALPLLGVKPEQTKSIMDGLSQARTFVSYLTTVWLILLLLVVGIGVGHYFLGVGLPGRISGTTWLVMTSGSAAMLIGLSAGRIFELVATNAKPPMPTWGVELGKSLVSQFFNFGALIGLGTGIIGLITIVVVIYLIKQGKIKEEKEATSLIKKVLSFVIGVILGFVILGTVVVMTAVALGGKVDFRVTEGSLNVP